MLSINQNIFNIKCNILENKNNSTFIFSTKNEELQKLLLNCSLSDELFYIGYSDDVTSYTSSRSRITYFGSNKFYVISFE